MRLMHWFILRVLGALPIALLVSPGQLTAQRDDPPEQISGILEGGWMAIGGEHTGWVLNRMTIRIASSSLTWRVATLRRRRSLAAMSPSSVDGWTSNTSNVGLC